MITPTRITLLALPLLTLFGCASTLPVVEPAIECPINEAELNRKCAEPAPIPAGMAFQDLVRITTADRKNLIECEKNRAYLQSALVACNAEIRKHNQKISDINKQNAHKP